MSIILRKAIRHCSFETPIPCYVNGSLQIKNIRESGAILAAQNLNKLVRSSRITVLIFNTLITKHNLCSETCINCTILNSIELNIFGMFYLLATVYICLHLMNELYVDFSAFVQCAIRMKTISTATGCACKILFKISQMFVYLDKVSCNLKDYSIKWFSIIRNVQSANKMELCGCLRFHYSKAFWYELQGFKWGWIFFFFNVFLVEFHCSRLKTNLILRKLSLVLTTSFYQNKRLKIDFLRILNCKDGLGQAKKVLK
jgi:hypothetical protein